MQAFHGKKVPFSQTLKIIRVVLNCNQSGRPVGSYDVVPHRFSEFELAVKPRVQTGAQ